MVIILLALALASCGSPKDSAEVPLEASPDPVPPAREVEESKTEAPTACLSDCNPAKSIVVSFQTATSVTPGGCTASDMEVFDVSTGLLAIVQANCSGQDALFAREISYEGLPATDARPVPEVCAPGSLGVTRFTAAQGNDGLLLEVTCRFSGGRFVTRIMPMAFDGQPGVPRIAREENLPSGQIPSPSYIAWNAGAGLFGVARNGSFRRVTATGEMLGGTVTIPTGARLTQLTSHHGHWSYLQGNSLASYGSAYCTKITPAGTLACDQLRFVNQLAYEHVTSIDGRWLLGVRAGGELRLGTFDPLTCVAGDFELAGSVVERKVTNIFSALPFGQRHVAMLYRGDTPTLNVAFLDTISKRVASTTAVLDGDSIPNARAFVAGGRLVVHAIRTNDAVISVSDQGVTPH